MRSLGVAFGVRRFCCVWGGLGWRPASAVPRAAELSVVSCLPRGSGELAPDGEHSLRRVPLSPLPVRCSHTVVRGGSGETRPSAVEPLVDCRPAGNNADLSQTGEM